MHVLVYEHLKSRHVHDQIIQNGCESYVLSEIAWLTCMQNVKALRTLHAPSYNIFDE